MIKYLQIAHDTPSNPTQTICIRALVTVNILVEL